MPRSPLLHPFAPPAQAEPDYIQLVRGEGSLVFDSSGTSYIDGMANLWLCQIGHGRAEMSAAIAAQLDELEGYNLFAPFGSPVSERAASMIVERSPMPGGRVYFGSSGSEAIDSVLKIARLTMQRRGETDRQIIITREGGYHGTTVGGTSVQGLAPNRAGWGDLLPHVVEVPRHDLEAAATVFAEHGERIAAVLTEPIQGASGVHPPADGYLAGLRRLCDDHGALLILDEVICGFGRTGEWFGSQTFDVRPDLVTFAKGVTSGYLPLSGVILSGALSDELSADADFMFRHGFTYSGHQTCCAAATANIEIIEREGLIARAEHIGEQFASGLGALASDGTIESYRGHGGIWAADLGHDAVAERDALLRAGVIMRPIGTSLAMCPPLIIADDEIATMLDALDAVLSG